MQSCAKLGLICIKLSEEGAELVSPHDIWTVKLLEQIATWMQFASFYVKPISTVGNTERWKMLFYFKEDESIWIFCKKSTISGTISLSSIVEKTVDNKTDTLCGMSFTLQPSTTSCK